MNSDMREYSRVVAMPFGDENVTTQLKNWFKRLSVRDEADSNGDSLFIVEESADDPVAQVIDHARRDFLGGIHPVHRQATYCQRLRHSDCA